MTLPCVRLQRLLLLLAVLLLGTGRVCADVPSLQLAAASSDKGKADGKIDFAHDIAPLLKARCAECHSNGKYKGSLSLETREELLKAKVVVPGKSDKSELFLRITHADPAKRMPSKGTPLSAKEIALVKDWIDQGLPWEAGFTFKVTAYIAPVKPRHPKLPPAKPGLEHPLDRLLEAYYAKRKLQPPALADDVTFIRRVYLDVIGLLPTPEQVEAFGKDDAADKRTKLAKQVLADKRAYADHWLTMWNDLLRNDYVGTGYIDGGRKQITKWLYQSLYDNKPYDQFARELIAPTPESEGFILGIKWRGNVNASQKRELQFAQNVSLVFFGVNMKCASCHDSFIDSWKLLDAYGLAAVIAEKPLEIHRCDVPQKKFAPTKFLWPELGDIDAKLPKAKRLEQLAKLVTQPDNGRFTRTIANRLWHRLMGWALVHPVDAMGGRPWDEDVLDHLATYLSDNGYDLKKLIEHILTSKAYQSRAAIFAKEPPGDGYVFRGPQLKRMSAEQFMDAIWQLTGTGPKKADAPITLPAFGPSMPKPHQLIRAALVKSDLLMRSLGRPNREQVVTTRPDVLTTLQALDLANSNTLHQYLAQGATNLLKAHPKAAAETLIDDVFHRALCRAPIDNEMATCRQIVGATPTKEGVADLFWCVVMLPEFQLIR